LIAIPIATQFIEEELIALFSFEEGKESRFYLKNIIA